MKNLTIVIRGEYEDGKEYFGTVGLDEINNCFRDIPLDENVKEVKERIYKLFNIEEK